jgi:acetolactate synthase I/II/III large subunit
MNGAESLVKTMLASGVDTCFANPGTSEMHFVAALDTHPDMRCILCLFEGGTSGAADGYFRMKRKPAATMLHLAPGFGNAFSNLHNARKAGSGVVNVMGEHATYHLKYNSPLRGDTDGISRAISHWTRTSESAADVARDGAAAIRAARSNDGQIATLILPANTAWGEGSDAKTAAPPPALHRPDAARLDAAAAMLRRPDTAFLVGGTALFGASRVLASQIAQSAGCRLIAPLFTPRMERGAGSLPIEQLFYMIEANMEMLTGLKHMVCCGAEPPVNFFAYPGKTSTPEPPDCQMLDLCAPTMDVTYCLEELADRLDARRETVAPVSLDLPEMPDGPLTPASAGAVIARLMPEDAIIVNESVTSGAPIFAATASARQHDWLPTMGGAIGQCLPAATGAAVACPDRKVLALSGDGSAMYTLQSLWTMARERLDVTVIIFANRGYQILWGELKNLGVDHVGRNAAAMFDVEDPTLDWVALAKGHGVEGARATTPAEFAAALQDGLDRPGPYLIEAVI